MQTGFNLIISTNNKKNDSTSICNSLGVSDIRDVYLINVILDKINIGDDDTEGYTWNDKYNSLMKQLSKYEKFLDSKPLCINCWYSSSYHSTSDLSEKQLLFLEEYYLGFQKYLSRSNILLVMPFQALFDIIQRDKLKDLFSKCTFSDDIIERFKRTLYSLIYRNFRSILISNRIPPDGFENGLFDSSLFKQFAVTDIGRYIYSSRILSELLNNDIYNVMFECFEYLSVDNFGILIGELLSNLKQDEREISIDVIQDHFQNIFGTIYFNILSKDLEYNRSYVKELKSENSKLKQDFDRLSKASDRLSKQLEDISVECNRLKQLEDRFKDESKQVPRDALRIWNFIKNRNINTLYHFTHKRNLPSILKEGIIPVQNLKSMDIEFKATDPNRYDRRTTHTSFSLEFPNEVYFKKNILSRIENDSNDFIILEVSSDLLLNRNCLYCKHNAASVEMKNCPDSILGSFDSLNELYSDINYKIQNKNDRSLYETKSISRTSFRSTLIGNIANRLFKPYSEINTKLLNTIMRRFPTNYQSEILIPGKIDTSYIKAIICPSQNISEFVLNCEFNSNTIIPCYIVPELFGTRNSYITGLYLKESKSEYY